MGDFLKTYGVLTVAAIALIQPWWELSGSSTDPIAERNTKMLMSPQVMIESIDYNDRTIVDIAEMPEIFVDLLGKIVLVVYAAFIVLALDFISTKLRKKHYSILFSLFGIILLISIIAMFYIGTSKLCGISIGDVQGEGMLDVSFDQGTVPMSSSWGFSSGFYLIVTSAILSFISFFKIVPLSFKHFV